MSKVLTDESFIETQAKSLDEVLEKRKSYFILKRTFDIVVSLLGLTVLLPIFIVIAVIIKLDSKGPVFFRQVRVGKDGREFKIFKFRTMVTNAEKKGMQITVDKDNRITKSGWFLRKYKIDELPQLINVALGDMSFVGPRPEVPKYVATFNKKQKIILKIKPGITDIASIHYRDESSLLSKSLDPEKIYIEEILPKKIELNLKYIEKMSMTYDILLILKTIYKVIF